MQTSLDAKQTGQPPALVQITRREAEILFWIGEGKTDWEIGVILRLKRKTVNYHAGQLLRKLGVQTRIQLVRRAVRAGLLDA